MNKKVIEVREVVQNRADSDIIKVLEYYDNDVGKTIDAFVNDGGKEALAKWAETKSQLNSSQSSLVSDSGKKRKNSPSKSQKPNLNDLVASVINQFTSSTPSTPLSSSLSPQEVKKPEPQFLIDSLSRLNTETSINGYKVTILGIETPSSGPAQSISSSTSPSSMSVTSTASSCDRPQLLDINNSLLKMNRQFNKSYINPNAKQVLEKSVKDLQRQTVQLNKVQSSLQDEVEKSSQLLNKTYQQLLKVLQDRKNQLDLDLKNSSQQALRLLQDRQSKAASLKHLTDNSQHLNDTELNELRADLKHFVSERLLDEEFSKLSLFSLEPSQMERLTGDLNSFGAVCQIKNQYSTQRPANIDEILTPVSNLNVSVVTEKQQQQQQQKQQQQQQQPQPVQQVPAKPQRNNINKNKQENKQVNGLTNGNVNGNANHVDDGEGEFIEVKKPQRNRYSKQNGVQQNGQINGTKPVVNGVQNGTTTATTANANRRR